MKHLRYYNQKSRKEARKQYYKKPKRCKYCNKIIHIKKKQQPAEARRKNFCNHSCAASYNNNGRPKVKKYCPICNKRHFNKKFCSLKCFHEFQYVEYIKRWKAGLENGIKGNSTSDTIRKYFLITYNSKCMRCGWAGTNLQTNKSTLVLHHKDGNWKNNKEDNIELICPNCHSLTPTYGILNKGNGRPNRYKHMRA